MKEFNYQLTKYSILNSMTGDVIYKSSTELGISDWVKANLGPGEHLMDYREINGFEKISDDLYAYLMEVIES